MSLSLLFADDFLSSPVLRHILIGFVGLLIPTSLILIPFVFLSDQHGKQEQNDKSSKSPPLAPATMLESIKGMSTNAPFFLQKMIRASNNDIIRLRLPIPGGAYAVANPTAMRAIFTDKKTDKPKEIYAHFNIALGGENVFSSANTKEWKAARKCLNLAFNASEVSRMNRICTEQVNSWIQNRLEPLIRKNEAFDPSAEMVKMTFNTILEAAFEYPEMPDDKEYKDFMHQLDITLKEFAGRHNGNPFRKYYGFLLSEYREAVKSSVAVMKFAAKILDAYRNNPNKSQNKTIIRMIVENESYPSDKERLSDIMTMVVAGHETTAFSLSTTLMLLAKHPHVTEKLRRELLSMDESKRSSRSGYLHNVIRESKRIYPVAALGAARVTGRELSLKDDSIVIPKGAVCFLPMLLTHNHKETFKDPENFRPERWENADDKCVKPSCPLHLEIGIVLDNRWQLRSSTPFFLDL